MTDDDLMIAPPPVRDSAKSAPDQRPPVQPVEAHVLLVLDMGEASREQGFRTFGCR